MTAKVLVDSRLHIPVKVVDADNIIKKMTHYEFENAVCKNCEFRSIRPSEECRQCSKGGLLDITVLAKYSDIKGKRYVSIPYGEMHRFERTTGLSLKEVKFVNGTSRVPFDYKVKFTGKLREYQEQPFKDMFGELCGVFKAPPRSGKCVWGGAHVDTSAGLLTMEKLWNIYGSDSEESVPVCGLNVATYMGQEPAVYIHRKRSPMVKIKTHMGVPFAGTPEHPILVATRDLKQVWKRMDELEIGDWVISSAGSLITDREPVSLSSVVAHTQALDITQPTVVNEKLAYVVGCLVANGALTRCKTLGGIYISSNVTEIRNKFSKYCSDLFGVVCTENLDTRHSNSGVWSVGFNSRVVVDFLETNGLHFGLSDSKSIPDFIMCSGQNIHRAFLSGYGSCDSGNQIQSVTYCTASSVLTRQLRAMLTGLGIVSRQSVKYKCATNGTRIKRPYGTLHVGANYMRKHRSLIHFDKNVTVGSKTGATVSEYSDNDIVPHLTWATKEHFTYEERKRLYGGRKHSKNKKGHMSRRTLARIDRSCLTEDMQAYAEAADKFYFHEVTEIKNLSEDWVYDLTVDGSHSFLADGFVVHNTVIGTAGACHSGFRTVIMADQKDFLDGFLETIEQMTNLPELEEKYGKKLYGFPKTLDDYKNFQIILVTYQSLISDSKNSKKRLKLLNENYGTLYVDECHAGNASAYSRVLASLKMKYRFGLTATPKRKDGRHYLLESIFGPVIAEAFVEEMVPKVTLHKTAKTVQTRANYNNKSGWVRFCKFLANHPDRNDRIFEWIIKDLDAGRSIAIPIMFTEQARTLVRRINEHYGEEIAAVFLGGAKEAKKRKPIIDAARRGDIRCVVGMRKLMQRGLNVPKWDTLYYIMPMNNEPNWKQESCRILTPMENKRTPVIRMFVDLKMERSVQCARSVLKFCWKFGYAKAKRTPKKLRDWMGVVGRGEALDAELPDFFEPEPRVKGQPSNLGMRRF